MDALSFAPALAMFTGLRFPSNLRAIEDDLDVVFEIADPAAVPAAYLDDRRAAVRRFRSENRRRLAEWLGAGVTPSWTTFYAHQRRAQHLRLVLALVVASGVLVFSLRRRGAGWGHALRFSIWSGLVVAATLALYTFVRGSLDFTSINARWEFISGAGAVCALVAVAGVFAHHVVVRNRRFLVGDQLTLVALAAAAIVLHVVVYGWPLGFPLPGPGLLFMPFLAPIFLVVQAVVTLALCGADLVRALRAAAQSA